MGTAVQMGTELDAALLYLAAVRQAEHLIAAAIGEDRLVLADELVQTAAPGDELITGPQHQVIGVPKDDLGVNFLKMVRRESLDGALGSDRHEDRRLDGTVSGLKSPPPRGPIGVGQCEQNKWSRPLIIVE